MNKRIATEEGDEDQGSIVRALPHHVIYEILARLPVKSLMRFKAVSKEWLYTIHDQSLATKFLIHRSTAAPTCLISFFTPPNLNHYYSLDLDSGLATPFEILNQPDFEGARIRNTVMGLTCFEAKGITYFLNLRTREVTALPQTDHDIDPRYRNVLSYTSSIGFDPVKGQYKILKTWTIPHPYSTGTPVPSTFCYKVITLGTSEWRKIDSGFPMRVYGGPVFLDGKLHYSTLNMHSKDIIVAFHVGTEKFEVIETPVVVLPKITDLIPYRNCLALVDFEKLGSERVMTVEVLEDYQDRKWVCKDVELPRVWKHWKLQCLSCDDIYASWISTGEILLIPNLLDLPFYVYRYDMEKRSMKEVEIHGLPDDLLTGEVYVSYPLEYGESIMSLKKLNLH